MSDLFSKVLSGGVSAAIFLLWWPAHVPADGPEWLVVRGLLWTLAFEILMLSFCPLERAVAAAVRERSAGTVTARGLARALALATAGLAVPAMLVAGTGGDLGTPEKASSAAPPKVIVKREIVRREVVVRRVSHVVRVPSGSAPAPIGTIAADPAPARAPRAASTASAAEKAPASGSSTRVVATAPKRQAPAAPTASAKATTTTSPSTTGVKPTATAPVATAPAATTATPATAASSAPATAPATGS